MDMYIPKNITSIHSNAFITSSNETWHFYFEASSGSNGYSNTGRISNGENFYNQVLDY